jgi:hypothetical protein
MSVDPREVIADRGGIWPVPFEKAERVLLTTQAKFDRRAIPSLWFWRLLRPDEGPGSTSQDEELWTSPRVARRYAAPIAIHLYVDWTPEKKGKKGPTVETTGVVPIGYSRAEARRLGRLIGVADDREGLVPDANVRADLVFIPRAGDVFQARGRYYEMQQLKPEWWGSTQIIATWKGTASMLRDDATAPGLASLPKPSTERPPLPEGVRWSG